MLRWIWARFDNLCGLPTTVLEGMDLVYKIEGQGSPSGSPKSTVTIRKSGELEGAASA